MTRSATQEVPFFLPLFLSCFLSLDFFVPNHCRCRGYSYNLSHTNKRARTRGRTPQDEVSVR